MRSRLLRPDDIKGAWAIVPTPATENASDWRSENTVDLDEAARVVNGLIDAGIDGILSMGTLGEAATLTHGEKLDYMRAIVDAAGGRVPVFVGTTCLNTRDTIALTREALALGADGTMLGIPMWCAPALDVSVQFYRDVAEAVPEMNIAVYANPEAFKFDFPRAFWAQVAEIPQVVTAKYIGVGTLLADLAAVKGNIKLLPIDFDYYAAARMVDEIDAFWSSGAVCHPLVTTSLRDIVAKARASGDWAAARALQARLGPTAAPLFPNGSFKEFSTYNIGLEKARMDAAGWMKAGPVRPPYHLVPEPFLAGARKSGTMWADLGRELEREQSTPLSLEAIP
ncbi:MAG: aldolase [Sphingopyxis sp.]|uniref:dihydrodipicolinate synthase family protein n=1 Tax=Sphingopyxis sp. TaxID=1908224 RepID=UPI003D810505